MQAIGKNLENRASQAKLDRLNLARLSDLNRNTIGAALSGSDMKLSTLIRLTRSLGFTDWLAPLIETPAPTPIELIAKRSKSAYKPLKIRESGSLTKGKPASRSMGRKSEDA